MNAVAYIISILAGLGMTLQAGVNTQLKERVGSPVLSALISFGIGFLGLVVISVLLLVKKTVELPDRSALYGAKWWMFTGGILGACYIFASIFAVPRIGFSTMFSLVIFGQIALAVLFDHFGVMGGSLHPLNAARLSGLLLLLVGVYLIQNN